MTRRDTENKLLMAEIKSVAVLAGIMNARKNHDLAVALIDSIYLLLSAAEDPSLHELEGDDQGPSWHLVENGGNYAP